MPLGNIYPNNPYVAQQNQIPLNQQMSGQQVNPNNNTNNTNIVFIQGGLQGAQSYPVPPGWTMSLWDTEQNVVYVKKVDVTGIPQPIRILDYTERENPQEQKEESTSYVTEERLNQVLDEKFASFAQSIKHNNKKYSNQKGGNRKNVKPNI